MQNCFARPQLPELLTDAQPPAQLGMLLGENQRELRDLHTIVTPWWWSRAARSGVAMNSPWTIAGQDQLASKCARLDLPAINHARQVSDRESKSSTKTLNEPLLGRHTGRIRMKESHHDPSVIAPWGVLHRTRRCELAESSIDRNTRQNELQNGNINAGGEERRAARRRNACGASGREATGAAACWPAAPDGHLAAPTLQVWPRSTKDPFHKHPKQTLPALAAPQRATQPPLCAAPRRLEQWWRPWSLLWAWTTCS